MPLHARKNRFACQRKPNIRIANNEFHTTNLAIYKILENIAPVNFHLVKRQVYGNDASETADVIARSLLEPLLSVFG